MQQIFSLHAKTSEQKEHIHMHFYPNNRADVSNNHAIMSLFPRNAFINTKPTQLFKS